MSYVKFKMLISMMLFFLLITSCYAQDDDEYEDDILSDIPIICLIVPALPWSFGPYQEQMYALSLQLHQKGYQIYWMSRVRQIDLPEERLYTRAEMMAQLPVQRGPPSDDFNDSHLTYLGKSNKNNILKFSDLNQLAVKFNIAAYITLMDIEMFDYDEDFQVPTILWLPYHFNRVSATDRLTIRGFSGIASLAPSSTRVIRDAVGEDTLVDFIPHIIDRTHLNSELHTLTREQLGIPQDAYLVLLQGGNYEEYDRKGWDTHIQAFAKFHQQYPNSYLYIHSVESTSIAGFEKNREAPAFVMPKGLHLRQRLYISGLPKQAYTLDSAIHHRGFVAGLKQLADVCLHASKTEGFGMNVLECQAMGTPVVTTKFMAMADYTKLGISVPHRQMYFTTAIGREIAMPDVLGIVDALADLYSYKLSSSSATSSASASDIIIEHPLPANLDVGSVKIKETQSWIDEEFSKEKVADSFTALLEKVMFKLKNKTPLEYKTFQQQPLYHIVRDSHPEPCDWNTQWTLIVEPNVKVDEEAIQQFIYKMLADASANNQAMAKSRNKVRENITPSAVIVPTRLSNGREMELMVDGQMNPRLTVLVRTHQFAGAQQASSFKNSLAFLILQRLQGIDGGQAISILPEGFAQVIPGSENDFSTRDGENLHGSHLTPTPATDYYNDQRNPTLPTKKRRSERSQNKQNPNNQGFGAGGSGRLRNKVHTSSFGSRGEKVSSKSKKNAHTGNTMF